MTTVFQLAPLPLEADGSPFASTSKLPDIRPRFVLPPLDDHLSGTERLLGSLRGSSRYDLQDLLTSSPTPKHGLDLQDAREQKVHGKVEKEDEVDEVDIWQKAVEQPEAGPSRRRMFEPLRTWDDLRLSEFEFRCQSPFLSERSIFTFDSLITSLEPPITLPSLGKTAGSIPVHDSAALLQIMLRSTLGTTSTEHLRWNSKKAAYVWIEEGGRPSGAERITANSMIRHFLEVGTSVRRLELIISSQSTLPLTPTHHALLHGLSTYVTFIKERLTVAVEENLNESQSSWIKWLGATQDVRELGQLLCEVMCWPISSSEAVALPTRSSALLSHVYNHLLASMSTTFLHSQSSSTLTLAFLFSQAVGPFLALLKAWVGLSDSPSQDEDIQPDSQPWSDLGITREMRQGHWEYTFLARRMPSFIPRSDGRNLFEAGKNLRILRGATGGSHPLCATVWNLDLGLKWDVEPSRDTRLHTRKVYKEVSRWKHLGNERKNNLSRSASTSKLSASVSQPIKKRRSIAADLFVPPSLPAFTETTTTQNGAPASHDVHTGIPELDDLWAQFSQTPGTHLARVGEAERVTKNLRTPTPLEQLRSFLSRHSTQALLHDSLTLPIFVSTQLLSPLLAHSSLISNSLVSLYLDDLEFLDHLDILYSYWLGGDMDFVHRVSGALFGKDTAGAGEGLGMGKRARTRMRLGLDTASSVRNDATAADDNPGEWGIGLGIGLSERSTWPPGGSELAYALRTTLLEDKLSAGKAAVGPWSEVQDRVSFAIRQLDEEDKGRRAKWMDPQGAALDFLYLSYSPPEPIAPLLPQSVLAKYQSIHNILLKISRCQIVIRTMYFSVLHQSESHDVPTKTGVDSGLARPSSRTTLRRSRDRQVDTLFPPNSSIEKLVQVLRLRMAHFVDAFGGYVDSVIHRKWMSMRKRLAKMRTNDQSGGNSRPTSPTSTQGEYFDPQEYLDQEEQQNDGDEGEHEEDEVFDGIQELKSPRSILAYHQITLNRILTSCLLDEASQGQQVTLKLLMTLFGLILDLGKVLVEIERGLKGWQVGEELIREIEGEWNEKERVFLHALERLSLRANKESDPRDELDILDEGRDDRDDTQDDVQQLLSHDRSGKGGEDDLKELLLRLKFGKVEVKREGRHQG
ncbi:uncharacterized protein I303_104383 [Kwoniella dejecticola CBS 10117]|uniref:Spindle pole body component n=1 Tax=Kwoniella dejecticola CBS 10117 TaxID=1296121 RepID=A0A1A6A5I0_9TREE|nr:uncharacterized protein I303_04640 [Kwoniella dejecticola CBS 10117]OBR85305.1 hypothetical protein I303_04640 [Kwoniella dejecticola CBS 10117]